MRVKPNIMIVSSYWAGNGTGGVGQMTSLLARELAKRHHVVLLINGWDSPEPRRMPGSGFDQIVFRMRSPWNPRRPVRGFIGWSIRCFRELRTLRNIIKDHGIDVIQVRFPDPAYLTFRVLRLLGGPPYCVSFHGNDVLLYQQHDWPTRVLLKWVIAGASATSAVSRSLATEVEKILPDIGTVRTIHNGKDIDDVVAAAGPLQAVPASSLQHPYFINPANVTWKKGQDVLIRAWAKLPQDVRHFRLLIAGEARDAWEPCRRLIDELGCGDRIHLLGPIPQSELFVVMRGARGCIMPSRHEGFSGSLLEAGAMRLGVVCTNIPSFREIVRHGENGLIVRNEDPDAMASAVAALARDPLLARRLGAALMTDVCTRFSAEQMAKNYVALYQEMHSLPGA